MAGWLWGKWRESDGFGGVLHGTPVSELGSLITDLLMISEVCYW